MAKSFGAPSSDKATSFAFGARNRNVIRLSDCTSGETTGAGAVCPKPTEAKAKTYNKDVIASLRVIPAPQRGKMVPDTRDHLECGGLAAAFTVLALLQSS